MSSKRDSAVALATQGYRIFPLVPNGKTPALEGNWRKIATTDPARVANMWTCPVMESELDFNIGIALDADTAIFDIDVRDGKAGYKSLSLIEAIYEEMPDTRTVRSPSGGEHREYTLLKPIGNSASKVGQHIDIKSEGGFVVGPGSTIDGVAYILERDIPRATMPAFIHTLAGEVKERPSLPQGEVLTELDTEAAKARAIDYLTHKAPDNGTYGVAAKVKDYGISQDLCGELMLEYWRDARNLDKDDAHVEFRIANAYRYGTSAPGIASPEAEFDAVEIDNTPPPKGRGLFFIAWQDAKPDLQQPFLIDEVMDHGAMVVTYGDSNAGKTYVVLDQAFHIAAGLPWNGLKVLQGLVVYIAAEGGKGFQKRIEAFRRHHKADNVPFALVPCPIDMHGESDTAKVVKVIRDAEKHFGQKCVLVVIDTLARAMGGGDENTSVDMSKFVGHCDRVRDATGATINIIHHTGKDKAKGARGSSALRAATDTEIEVEPGTLTVRKQRDMDTSGRWNFDLVKVDVGHRADGKAVTAAVVSWVKPSEFEARVTPAAAEMLSLFEQVLEGRREELAELDEDPDTAEVSWNAWQMSGLSHFKGPGGKQVSAAYLYKLRKELVTSGVIVESKRKQWVRGNSNLSNPSVT